MNNTQFFSMNLISLSQLHISLHEFNIDHILETWDERILIRSGNYWMYLMGMEGDYDTRNYEDDLGNKSRILFEAKGEFTG
jgi:hypothetical protein